MSLFAFDSPGYCLGIILLIELFTVKNDLVWRVNYGPAYKVLCDLSLVIR